MQKLIIGLLAICLCMTHIYAETKLNYFPLNGDKPMPEDNPAVNVSNGPSLKYDSEGLLLGTGFAGPDIKLKDWNGAEGTVAFWIKPLTWDAETKPSLILFRSLGEKDGAFLFYKYEDVKQLWLYTAAEKGQIDVPLKYEGLKDWKKGDWHHIAFTWKKGSFAKMYIDGILVCIKEGSYFFPKSFQGIRIAQGSITSGWGVEGKTIMRDLYLAAYPLTDGEIALFAQNKPEIHPAAK